MGTIIAFGAYWGCMKTAVCRLKEIRWIFYCAVLAHFWTTVTIIYDKFVRQMLVTEQHCGAGLVSCWHGFVLDTPGLVVSLSC